MKNVRMAIGGMVLTACLFAFACAAPDMVRVKMDYTPTNVLPPPKTFPEKPIFIGSFEDKRKTPDQVGQNSEKPKIIPAKVDPAEVSAFMRTAFIREFKRAKFNVVDSEKAAQKIVKGALLNLWVEEKNTYDASVVTEIIVTDGSGKKLFDQNFRALTTRWGRSHKEDEYRKVLSDTAGELIKNLFSNEAFLKSLN